MNKLVLTLVIGFLVPVLVPAPGQIKPIQPQPGPCGGCLCILPGSSVTVPAGRCGMTSPGGDVIHATGGDVTVTAGASGKLTGIGLAPAAWADVTIVNGPTSLDVTGAAGTVAFAGQGNTISNNSNGADIAVSGTGNAVHHHAPLGTLPNYFSTSYANHLYAHGTTNFTTTGNITVHP